MRDQRRATMARSDGCVYFKRTSLSWIISVTLAIGHFTVIVFAPEMFPYNILGPYGTFCRYLVDNHSDLLYKVWLAALAVHVIEAFTALNLCRKKGIDNTVTRCLWFVQTFLFGFASLGHLLKYNPGRAKQQ